MTCMMPVGFLIGSPYCASVEATNCLGDFSTWQLVHVDARHWPCFGSYRHFMHSVLLRFRVDLGTVAALPGSIRVVSADEAAAGRLSNVRLCDAEGPSDSGRRNQQIARLQYEALVG